MSNQDDAWQGVIDRVVQALADLPADQGRDALVRIVEQARDLPGAGALEDDAPDDDDQRPFRLLPGGRSSLSHDDDDDDDLWSGDLPPWGQDAWSGALSANILVAPGGQQPVLRSAVTRAYRVACTAGSMTVVTDGVDVARLDVGQTVDVEGGSIDVLNSGPALAEGRFQRLA